MEFKEVIDSGLFSFKEWEEDGEKRMQVTAVVQQADVVNKNNRLYSRDVLEAAADHYQAKVEGGKSFGSVDHPAGRAKLGDTSHLMKSLEWRGKEEDPTGKQNLLVGELLILKTPSGNALAEIIRAGGRPGISSRGKGESKTVKVDGKEVERIQEGFRFEGFDFVVDPSVESAEIKRYSEAVADRTKFLASDAEVSHTKPKDDNFLAKAMQAIEGVDLTKLKKAEPKPVSEDEVKELTKRMAR